MTRSALPQNYTTNYGSVFYAFNTLTGWGDAYGYGGTLSLDTVNHIASTAGLNVVSVGGANVGYKKTISLKVTNNNVMGVRFYIYDIDTFSSLILYLSSTANLSKYMAFTIDKTTRGLVQGWNFITIARSEWSIAGGESWDNTMILLQFKAVATTGNLANVTLDSLAMGVERVPRLMIMFDDGAAASYTNGMAYMNARGLYGTMYVTQNLIDTAGFMTLAELQAMYALGWDVGNHTYSHLNLATATAAQIEIEVKGCTDWLVAQGMPRSAYHLAYPNGQVNAAVKAAVEALGIITGRTVSAQLQISPPPDYYEINTRAVEAATALATIKGYVDTAINNKTTCCLLFHTIQAVPTAPDYATADFQAFIDYVVERGIKCVGINEWYKGLTNPRYRSVPLSRATV